MKSAGECDGKRKGADVPAIEDRSALAPLCHRDPERAPQRSGVDPVGLVGFNLEWLSGRKQTQ